MRERDETPTFIIERDGGSSVGAFLIGALLGAGAALLLAPRSGEETQAQIRERATQLRDTAEERLREAQAQIEARLEQAREELMERVEAVKEAVESGKVSAHEARAELEEKIERTKAAYRAGVEAARDVAVEGEEAS